jgi:hypothetical protein
MAGDQAGVIEQYIAAQRDGDSAAMAKLGDGTHNG